MSKEYREHEGNHVIFPKGMFRESEVFNITVDVKHK
jgi:hypothetical protein